jgi:hypothetical protein
VHTHTTHTHTHTHHTHTHTHTQRKEIKASPAKIAEVQFARGVLTFCMAEALSAGYIYWGIHSNGTRVQAAQGLYQVLQFVASSSSHARAGCQDVSGSWRRALF